MCLSRTFFRFAGLGEAILYHKDNVIVNNGCHIVTKRNKEICDKFSVEVIRVTSFTQERLVKKEQ